MAAATAVRAAAPTAAMEATATVVAT